MAIGQIKFCAAHFFLGVARPLKNAHDKPHG
jgi:hypothetical protein